MRSMLSAAAAAVVLLSAAGSASAAFIPNALAGVTGIPYHQGDSGTLNADGNIARVFNGSGLNVGNPATPSTWTHVTGWQNGWQSNNSTTAGTLIADLGATTSLLKDMYLWNVNEGTTTVNRGTKTMDVYYATSPTVVPTAGTNYNFASGGWTLLASNVSVAIGSGAAEIPFSAVVDLTSIPAARYIGMNLKENHGATTRIGLAEVQITQVPEPVGVAAIGTVALAGLAGRRRRRSGDR